MQEIQADRSKERRKSLWKRILRNKDTLTGERVREISRDIGIYEDAIRNAEGASAEAEREPDELPAEAYRSQGQESFGKSAQQA